MRKLDRQIINEKKNEVRDVYVQYGFKSDEYEKAFDELHLMNIKYMAQRYRAIHGMSRYSKTPYCGE